jgi:hypothetical protein
MRVSHSRYDADSPTHVHTSARSTTALYARWLGQPCDGGWGTSIGLPHLDLDLFLRILDIEVIDVACLLSNRLNLGSQT